MSTPSNNTAVTDPASETDSGKKHFILASAWAPGPVCTQLALGKSVETCLALRLGNTAEKIVFMFTPHRITWSLIVKILDRRAALAAIRELLEEIFSCKTLHMAWRCHDEMIWRTAHIGSIYETLFGAEIPPDFLDMKATHHRPDISQSIVQSLLQTLSEQPTRPAND
jgi:hypothetical protein